MRRIYPLILLLLTLSLFTSCGGSSGGDDNDSNNQQACLSDKQETDIRTLLNRLSSIAIIRGTTVATVTNSDGTTSTAILGSIWDFDAVNNNQWAVNYLACDANGICDESDFDLEFSNGCFEVDNSVAKIVTSNPSSLRFETTDPDGTRYDDQLSVSSSDDMKFQERVYRNGALVEVYVFE